MKPGRNTSLCFTTDSPKNIRLTKREQEVLQLTLKEYTSKEIGNMLSISSRTVEVHRQNLIRKYEVKSLVGLVRDAVVMYCRKEQSARTIAKGSEYSPRITYFSETGELEIKGKALALARPEIYKRLLNHFIQSNVIDRKGLKCVLDLTDIDVCSQKILYDLLKQIETIYKSGCKSSITWKYTKDTIDLKEMADDFASMVDVPFAVTMN